MRGGEGKRRGGGVQVGNSTPCPVSRTKETLLAGWCAEEMMQARSVTNESGAFRTRSEGIDLHTAWLRPLRHGFSPTWGYINILLAALNLLGSGAICKSLYGFKHSGQLLSGVLTAAFGAGLEVVRHGTQRSAASS